MDDADFDDDWPEDSEEYFTVPCPNCGAETFEDTLYCPVCGEFIVEERSLQRHWDDKPAWYIVIAVLGIIAVIWSILRI